MKWIDAPVTKGAAEQFVCNCMQPLGKQAIRNVTTTMRLLETDTHLLPVSVNDGDDAADNCYVVSPETTYIGYAKDELTRIPYPKTAKMLTWLIDGVAQGLAAAQLNRLVQINNWLLSTNLYPVAWRGEALPTITQQLIDTYPQHAIVFRSLNRFSNAELLARLRAIGYIAIPSRQVYLFDGRAGEHAPLLSRHNTRLDAKHLSRMPYQIVHGSALQEDDFPRLEQLYNLLYLDKYCRLNPQFTADWLRCGQRDGWLELRVLCTATGRIDGVVGWFANEAILTAPIVGYDTSLPKQYGLYRLLTQMCLQEAVQRRCVLNFSSGAAHFKRLRGGQAEIEYSMVYVRHLPFARRFWWQLLGYLLRLLGVPMLKIGKL